MAPGAGILEYGAVPLVMTAALAASLLVLVLFGISRYHTRDGVDGHTAEAEHRDV